MGSFGTMMSRHREVSPAMTITNPATGTWITCSDCTSSYRAGGQCPTCHPTVRPVPTSDTATT